MLLPDAIGESAYDAAWQETVRNTSYYVELDAERPGYIVTMTEGGGAASIVGHCDTLTGVDDWLGTDIEAWFPSQENES